MTNKIVGAFLSCVFTYNLLPIIGNTLGDVRITEDDGRQWYWSIISTTGNISNWLPFDDITTTGQTPLWERWFED